MIFALVLVSVIVVSIAALVAVNMICETYKEVAKLSIEAEVSRSPLDDNLFGE